MYVGIWDRRRFAETDRKFEGSEAFRRGADLLGKRAALPSIQHVLDRAVRIQWHGFLDRAAQQPVNGLSDDLAGEVPQRDVDSADRGDVSYEEMRLGGHPVEVSFDGQGIFAHQALTDKQEPVPRELHMAA